MFFFFKQKTAYEMRISDWSSDVCSSDLGDEGPIGGEQLSFAIGQCRHHARLADPVAGLARDEPARVANEVHILRTTERPQQMGSGEAGAFDGEAESEAGVAQLEIGRAHV